MIKRSLLIFTVLLVLIVTLGNLYLWFNKSLPTSEEREEEPSEADVVEKMDELYSEKELGAILVPEKTQTVFRVFSPRAEKMDLCILSGPLEDLTDADEDQIAETFPMVRDEQGVWETVVDRLLVGEHYLFRIESPEGDGNPEYVGDPYARAVAHAANSCIVVDPNATNKWFSGWTDEDYETVDLGRTVIYNTHVRDFTAHPSSGVAKKLRGTFQGIPATIGSKAGIDHMQKLGATTLGLMPVSEFANRKNEYGWGYSPAYPFAPEASYGTEPVEGSQYYELKAMVARLHSEGIGVIVDLACAQAGESNPLLAIDKLYYRRSETKDGGNGAKGETSVPLRTDAPMMKRLILDNVRYWIEEFHIDGVHLPEAGELSMDTLAKISESARDINPDFVLIAGEEGLSDDEKVRLIEADWQILNHDFCDRARSFVKGEGDRDFLGQFFAGEERPSGSKLHQAVNAISAPEKLTLADALRSNDSLSGINLTSPYVKRSSMAATLLLTAPGIPMLNAGQDFLRSKNSLKSTFDEGDRVNAIDWSNRGDKMPNQLMRYYRGLIKLRQSDPGRALRNLMPGGGDCELLLPEDESLLGFVINRSGRLPGNPAVLLFNTAKKATYFEVPFPAGQWRLVGDGTRIARNGLPSGYSIHEERMKTVLMPALSSRLFIRY